MHSWTCFLGTSKSLREELYRRGITVIKVFQNYFTTLGVQMSNLAALLRQVPRSLFFPIVSHPRIHQPAYVRSTDSVCSVCIKYAQPCTIRELYTATVLCCKTAVKTGKTASTHRLNALNLAYSFSVLWIIIIIFLPRHTHETSAQHLPETPEVTLFQTGVGVRPLLKM